MKNEMKKIIKNEKSKTISQTKKKTDESIEESFQDLSYLKAVPRRVDCWLDSGKSGRSS